MSAAQIQPTKTSSIDSSSLDEEKKHAALSNEKKEHLPQSLQFEDGDGEEFDDDPLTGAVALPWTKKLPALILILMFVFGSNFAGSAFSPLKSTIKKEMSVNNAQYGVLASADSLINSILPIVTGIAIDYYGPSYGAIVASIFIFVGQTLTAVGAQITSFPLMVVGQIILGFGGTAIETAQSKLYTHWFKAMPGGGVGIIGFVYGLDIGIGRVYNLCGKLTAVPIMDASGSWKWSMWVPAFFCALSLAIVIIYAIFERSIPEENRVMTGRKLAARRAARGVVETRTSIATRYNYVKNSIFAIPAAFWLLILSQLLQSSAVSAYSSNLADIIAVTRAATKETAGYTASIAQVMPIVLTPVLGYAFDLWGRRMFLVSFTAAIWVLCFSLLGFSTVHAMAPTILGSLALAFNALPFICSIPLLVPNQNNLGTAFGLWKAFNSSGATILTVATGAIQDRTPTGVNQYDNVMYLLIALKAVDVFYGFVYHWFDVKYLHGVLRASERDRVKIEITETEEERTRGLRSPIKKVTYVGIAFTFSIILTAYVVYITYSLGT